MVGGGVGGGGRVEVGMDDGREGRVEYVEGRGSEVSGRAGASVRKSLGY